MQCCLSSLVFAWYRVNLFLHLSTLRWPFPFPFFLFGGLKLLPIFFIYFLLARVPSVARVNRVRENSNLIPPGHFMCLPSLSPPSPLQPSPFQPPHCNPPHLPLPVAPLPITPSLSPSLSPSPCLPLPISPSLLPPPPPYPSPSCPPSTPPRLPIPVSPSPLPPLAI